MRRFWEYGLLGTIAMAVGLAVAAALEFAMEGGGTAVGAGSDELLATVVPAMAGLVAVVLTFDVGLRRLNRARPGIDW